MWQNLINSCAPQLTISTDSSILDMGCGPAGIFMSFPENPVTAVDPLIESYEADLDVFSKNKYPNVQFIQSGIESFKCNKPYDIVFCMNAINHVKDIKAGFKTLADCCKKGGTVVITIDAHTSNFMKGIFRIGPGDILHPHQYDKKEYCAFLTDNGFKVVKEVTIEKGKVFDYYMIVAEKV